MEIPPPWVSFHFFFHFKLLIHKIPSAYKDKVLVIIFIQRKILRANRIADFPGSRVLITLGSGTKGIF